MTMPCALLVLQEVATAQPPGVMFWVLTIALVVLIIASLWRIFEKAGQPGWAAIVPIYNFIVMLRIAGKPLWWILLMLIPFVNIIVAILVVVAIARNFGKGIGFAIGMMFLGFIFYPILAFGDAQYQPRPT